MCARPRAGAGVLLVAHLCLSLAGQVAAGAQDAETLERLKRLHDEFARADRVLSVAEGKQALRRLHGLDLPEALAGAQRVQVLAIRLYAALAVGDARRAAGYLAELREAAPDRRSTWDAAHLVACATGDAQLGDQAVKQLRKLGGADERRLLARRRRGLRLVGKPAPEITITTEEGLEVSPSERKGVVLLLDFWSVRTPPSAEQSAALRKVYDELRSDRKLEFLGVNTDGAARVDAARALARKAGYVWSQHYERGAPRAESVGRAFAAGPPPWQIVVDQLGYIRAVGALSEPGFRYALRAAVAEAKRRYEPVLPKTRAGKEAEPNEPVAGVGRRAQPGKAERAADRPLPSNPEAARKFRLARTFLKTGRRRDAKRLFEEIVRDFPGTLEAKQAREFLDNWP